MNSRPINPLGFGILYPDSPMNIHSVAAAIKTRAVTSVIGGMLVREILFSANGTPTGFRAE
jgi:hypothetical protein